MARQQSATDFKVSVEGVGDFVFAKRTMRDELKVQVEFARLTEGVKPTPWLDAVGGWLADLRVLTVSAPDGWDLDSFDPLDPETYEKLGKVHGELTKQERSFRRKPGEASEAGGARPGADA